jgi:hypothetical protein
MRVRYRQRALIDLAEIYDYLTERSPAGARNLFAAFDPSSTVARGEWGVSHCNC